MIMPLELRVLLAWGAAFGLTYALTPLVGHLAHRNGMVDMPRGRHAHDRPTPLLGGLAIFAGIMAAALLLSPDRSMAVSLPLALGAGLVDDYCKCKGKELPAAPKLALQFLPATMLVLMGNTIHHVSSPFGPGMLLLPWWLDYPLTLAWLVGMTNAVNFLDGMDGMVAGVGSVAAFTLMILSLVKGDPRTAIWVAATLGSCLAFLRYNFPPASIFMGDGGSNFLGFLLASLSVTGYFKAATLAGLAAPLLVLSVPMLNVLYVVVRRIRQGKGLIQALTEGDLEHSFNVFRRRTNFSPTETVLVFLMAAMLLSASALGFVFAYR